MSVWGVSLIRDVCLGWGTYHVVLDAIDLGVSLIGAADLVEVVLNPVDAQHANLLERPAGHALGELAVERLDGLGGAGLLHLGVEPLVGEDLGRSDQCEARRRARLERRDERELLAGRERVVDRLGLGAGVVAVGGRGGAEQRRQELAGAEGGAYAVGEGNDLVSGGAGAEDVLDARAVAAGGREEEHVVLVGGAGRVVVEVVDDEAGALSGELDVELGEEGDEGGRGRGVGAQGDEDVAVGVEELEEQLAGQLGAQACDGRLAWRRGIWGLEVLLTLQLGREEDDMVVCSLAEVEQRQRLALWCLERQLEPSACSAPLVSETLAMDPKEGENALFRSPRNLEYPACSAASSRTTSSLSPVVLMADTTVASTRTAKDRSDLMVAQQDKIKRKKRDTAPIPVEEGKEAAGQSTGTKRVVECSCQMRWATGGFELAISRQLPLSQAASSAFGIRSPLPSPFPQSFDRGAGVVRVFQPHAAGRHPELQAPPNSTAVLPGQLNVTNTRSSQPRPIRPPSTTTGQVNSVRPPPPIPPIQHP